MEPVVGIVLSPPPAQSTAHQTLRRPQGRASPGRIVLCLLLTGTALQGCARQWAHTQSASQVRQTATLTKERAVRIEPCEDRTGFAEGRDLPREATRTLTEKVRDSELFTITTEALLILTCDIEFFAEGSALKRWALPGWGATQARVVVMVWETPGDNVLATLRSQSSVRGGGLYTIGADQYILGVAFDDIVEQLERWATGDTLGGRPLR